jgi:hypothetical protein
VYEDTSIGWFRVVVMAATGSALGVGKILLVGGFLRASPFVLVAFAEEADMVVPEDEVEDIEEDELVL